MKHVLIISEDFEPHTRGGAGVIATTLAKGLAKKHKVSVITAVTEPTKKYNIQSITVFPILVQESKRMRNVTTLNNAKRKQQVAQLIKTIKPDIINIHNVANLLGFSTVQAATDYMQNVYFTAHDCMTFLQNKLDTPQYKLNKSVEVSRLDELLAAKTYYVPFRKQIIRHKIKGVKKIICVSDELKRALKMNKVHKNYKVIRNGVDTNKTTKQHAESFKKKYGLSSPTFLFAGRISQQKGFDQAVKIVEEIRKTFPFATLLVCGKQQDNAKPFITYTGWINQQQMAAAYAAADAVLVLSQYLDPFPTVNLEALAHGKLLFTTKYGGSCESVDKDSGVIIDPTKCKETAAVIIDTLGDQKRVRRLQQNAATRYKKYFTTKHMIEKYETVLDL